LSYVHQWEAIVAALTGGGAPPASVQDGRQAAAVLQAALRSTEEGRAVAPTAA
jgi:predicted dehydrogenase